MNVRRQSGQKPQGPVGGSKNATSPQVKNSDGGKPCAIKNSVSIQPKSPGPIVPRNSVAKQRS